VTFLEVDGLLLALFPVMQPLSLFNDHVVTSCNGSPLGRLVRQSRFMLKGDVRKPFSSMRSTKKLIAKRPCTHRLPEFTSDFIQRQRLVDIIESTSLETKI